MTSSCLNSRWFAEFSDSNLRVHANRTNVIITSAQKFKFKIYTQKMTLIFLLHISSLLAKKEDRWNSTLFENEIQDQTKLENLFGQPKFNTSCDLESLEAANECELRVLNLFQHPSWRS